MIWQVIKFLDLEEREKFKKNVDNFLVDLQIEREIHEFTEKSIYDNAQTKEERQKYLDKFFRVICLQVYDINVKFYFSFCLFLHPPPPSPLQKITQNETYTKRTRFIAATKLTLPQLYLSFL